MIVQTILSAAPGAVTSHLGNGFSRHGDPHTALECDLGKTAEMAAADPVSDALTPYIVARFWKPGNRRRSRGQRRGFKLMVIVT
jgi:hypothetical protein